MPYIAQDLEHKLASNGTSMVGNGQCVSLVKAWTGAPASSLWTQGAKVEGNTMISKGTAIATFVNGVYPNWGSGNHAAIYLYSTADGIRVIDQWTGRTHHYPQERTIRFDGGSNLSNNASAYYVVE
jgi:hypothetical protein